MGTETCEHTKITILEWPWEALWDRKEESFIECQSEGEIMKLRCHTCGRIWTEDDPEFERLVNEFARVYYANESRPLS